MPDKSPLSQVQQQLVEQAMNLLHECDFGGVVLLVCGTSRGKKGKMETFKESFFDGNMLANVKMLEHFAEYGDPNDYEEPEEKSAKEPAEDDEEDDDGDEWKKEPVTC